ENGNGVRTIALVSAHPGAPATEIAQTLQAQLKVRGRPLVVDAGMVDSRFGRAGAANTARGAALESSLTYWLNEAEAAHDYVILLTDEASGQWTQRCLGRADQVLVVARADADHRPGPVEQQLAARPAGDVQLLLVHPDDTIRPEGTARWLEARP